MDDAMWQRHSRRLLSHKSVTSGGADLHTIHHGFVELQTVNYIAFTQFNRICVIRLRLIREFFLKKLTLVVSFSVSEFKLFQLKFNLKKVSIKHELSYVAYFSQCDLYSAYFQLRSMHPFIFISLQHRLEYFEDPFSS